MKPLELKHVYPLYAAPEALLLLGFVVLLLAAPYLDDNGDEHLQALKLEQEQQRLAKLEEVYRRECVTRFGANTAWRERADGKFQCLTKHGRPTLTLPMNPLFIGGL